MFQPLSQSCRPDAVGFVGEVRPVSGVLFLESVPLTEKAIEIEEGNVFMTRVGLKFLVQRSDVGFVFSVGSIQGGLNVTGWTRPSRSVSRIST